MTTHDQSESQVQHDVTAEKLASSTSSRVRLRAQDAVRVRAWVEAEGQVTR